LQDRNPFYRAEQDIAGRREEPSTTGVRTWNQRGRHTLHLIDYYHVFRGAYGLFDPFNVFIPCIRRGEI